MRFQTTHWSVVQVASDSADPAYRDALEHLCRTYWPAVYSYLRSRGNDPDGAADLTQAFFTRLIEKKSLRAADSERGRFRSFLLTSVQNFAANERRHAEAEKRGGGTVALSFDLSGAESLVPEEWIDRLTPEAIFDRGWAYTLLRRAMDRLEEELAGAGKRDLFRLLKPALVGASQSAPYEELAEQLGLSKANLKVTVHRQRKRFGALLREEVAETLSDPLILDDEMKHLLGVLAG